jgi:cob(I)alamin adenosyltransferase
VCRRAEREVVALSQAELVNPLVIVFLNRLSDCLFVLARVADRREHREELWTPGENQQEK